MSELSTRATPSRAKPTAIPVRVGDRGGHEAAAAASAHGSAASTATSTLVSSFDAMSVASRTATTDGAGLTHHASSDSVTSLDESMSSRSMQDFIEREIQRCFPGPEFVFRSDEDTAEPAARSETSEPIVGRSLAHLLAGQAPDVVANLHSALLARGFAAGQGIIRENSEHVFEMFLSSSEPTKTLKRRKLPPRPPVNPELLKQREALNAQPIEKILEFIDGPASSSSKPALSRGRSMIEPSSRKAQLRRARRLAAAASAPGELASSVASRVGSMTAIARPIAEASAREAGAAHVVETPPAPSAVIARISQQRYPQGYVRPQPRTAADAVTLPPALRELYTKFGELENSSQPSWPGAVWQGLRYAEGPDRAFPVPVQNPPLAHQTHEVLKSARLLLERSSISPGLVLSSMAAKLNAPLDKNLGSFYVLSSDVRHALQAVSGLPRVSQLPVLYSTLYRLLKNNAQISNPVVNLLSDAAQRTMIRQHKKYTAQTPVFQAE